jgi:hypothetical protein
MNIDNLNKLIKFFEELPTEKVNLWDWRTCINGDMGGYVSDDELRDGCDTCGCVVGWLPVITGIPVSKYKFKQLEKFLDIDSDAAYSIARRNDSTKISDKEVVLERLKKLLGQSDSVL